MIERSCGVPEERWVDWHLKRLPPEQALAMERHLAACSECRLVHRQWGEWLGVTGSSETETAAVPPMPPERVRRSLRFSLWRKRWKRRLARRPLVLAGGALAAVMVLAVQLLTGVLEGPVRETATASLKPIEYAQMHEPDGAVLMNLPDTKMFTMTPVYAPVMPESAGNKAITVWVNDRTGEIFVLVEGLLPAASSDVQAWGGYRQELTNLGLLEFHRAQGHLYSRDSRLPEVKEVAFTIEPKGGSLKPTAPETARVRLKEGN